ncbi:MAG: hypothetical protein ACRCX2_14195 [Paraclostridium sp.]
MRIIEKNEGRKIPYEVMKTKVIFDDMLMVDLARYQKDEEQVIDICIDNNEMLSMGLTGWYVANIVIPPKQYDLVENGVDENNNPKYEKVAKALNMDEVTLHLWALPENYGYFSLNI